MSSDYDEKLSAIRHFQLHPEMLPYAGPQYNDCRILLIGESHYIGSQYAGDVKFCEELHSHWYEWSTDRFKWTDPVSDPGWFNTRGIQYEFLVHNRNRAHSMFHNPAMIFCGILKEETGMTITDCDAVSCTAFCNYFQRPEIVTGATFEPTEEDLEKSAEIITQIIGALQPKIVVFLSKKAYRAYSGKADISDIPYIHCVNHPTSASWNNAGGREKYYEIMKRYYLDNDSSILPALLKVNEQKLSIVKAVFDGLYVCLRRRGSAFDGYSTVISEYYKERGALPFIDYVMPYKDRKLSLHIEATDNLYFGICGWDEDRGCIKPRPDSTDCSYAAEIKGSLDTYGRSASYCWWNYLPSNDHKLCFNDRGAEFDSLTDPERMDRLTGTCIEMIEKSVKTR